MVTEQNCQTQSKSVGKNILRTVFMCSDSFEYMSGLECFLSKTKDYSLKIRENGASSQAHICDVIIKRVYGVHYRPLYPEDTHKLTVLKMELFVNRTFYQPNFLQIDFFEDIPASKQKIHILL